MTKPLSIESLIRIADRACPGAEVRDPGLLEAALARPMASMLGVEAYPSIHGKAAALLHSLVKNHALVDGNKRLAWQACAVFLWINGHDLDAPEDDAYDFVIAVADGSLSDVQKMAQQLAQWSVPRQSRGVMP